MSYSRQQLRDNRKKVTRLARLMNSGGGIGHQLRDALRLCDTMEPVEMRDKVAQDFLAVYGVSIGDRLVQEEGSA